MAGFAPRHHHYLLLTVPLCDLLLTVSVHPRCVQLEELYPGIRHKLAVALQVLGGGRGLGLGRAGSGGVERKAWVCECGPAGELRSKHNLAFTLCGWCED